MNLDRRRVLFILSTVFLLGACLRFYHLGDKSLWTDELATMANAAQIVDLKSFLAHSRGDDLPKFYSLLLKFWMHLGNSEFAMRLLSVIFGILSIPATFVVSRLFFDIRTSLLAALLTALSPFLLIYDRDIRMYSLFALLSLFSTYFFIRSLRENRNALWAAFAFTSVLNIYTHYYAFLILGVQWLYCIFRWREFKVLLKPILTANIVILLFFAIRLSSFIQDLAYFAPWSMPREKFSFIYAKHFVEFVYVVFSFSAGQTLLPWNPISPLLFLVVILWFVMAVRKGLSVSRDSVYLLMLIFIPIAIGIVFRISLPRYFIFAAPIFFILIARGFWLLPKKVLIATALIVTIGWGYGLLNYYQNREFHYMAYVDPWREIAQYLKNNISGGEDIMIVGVGVVPLSHYFGSPLPSFGGEALVEKVRESNKTLSKRIWLVYTYQEEYVFWLKARDILSRNYAVVREKKWSPDPDFEIKRKFFKRPFAPYRIVAELYQQKT